MKKLKVTLYKAETTGLNGYSMPEDSLTTSLEKLRPDYIIPVHCEDSQCLMKLSWDNKTKSIIGVIEANDEQISEITKSHVYGSGIGYMGNGIATLTEITHAYLDSDEEVSQHQKDKKADMKLYNELLSYGLFKAQELK